MKGLILGAGITGLTAGIKTGYPIYEAADKPGGICRSYDTMGYHFNNGGGHWVFGDMRLKDFFRTYGNGLEYARRAGVYINNIYSYPIQAELKRQSSVKEGTMKAWLNKNFGEEMCNLFFYPFNNKYTSGLYEEVAQDDPVKTPRAGETGYNDSFFYPKNGLSMSIAKMADGQDIRYNSRVVHVDLNNRVIFFENGLIDNYDRLISTLPLQEMLAMTSLNMDYDVRDLRSTSVIVINIGATKGVRCPKEHWLYIPGEEDQFFRVGFYSNVDASFAPEDHVGIYVERSFYGSEEVLSEDYLEAYKIQIIDRLRELGWIESVDVVDVNVIKYAYTWVMPGNRREFYISKLKENRVESIGRYGKWRFQGVAQSIQDGLDLS